jgi:(1->4)-alpha-D-glucan 1-alpha-D-glucosylmutase
VDGLLDPREYLERLRAKAGPSLYLVVEKILAHHEKLREDWPVEGTTGYEFCGQVTGLLVDGTAEDAFTRFYREFTGEWQAFPEIVRECKIKIMENEMRSELEALSREAVKVARQNPRTTDFTQNILCRALKETIACFPVYRTYVDGARCDETDERYIHWAITQAAERENGGSTRQRNRQAGGDSLRHESATIQWAGGGQGSGGHRFLPIQPFCCPE